MNAFFRCAIKKILIAILSLFYQILGVDKIYKSYLYYDIDSIPANVHYCLILGARLFENNSITPMLSRRMDSAMAIFEKRPEITFILSGDASKRISNDVQAMYLYLKQHCAISDEQIIFDNEGYTTYDSIRHITPQIDSEGFILLTSAFHMPRCVYLCHCLGLHPYALHVPSLSSKNISWYHLRELSALVKTWFLLKFGTLHSHKYLSKFILYLAFLIGKILFIFLRLLKKSCLYYPGKIALTLYSNLLQYLTAQLSVIFIVGTEKKSTTCLALEKVLAASQIDFFSNPSEDCTLYEATSVLLSHHSLLKKRAKQYLILKCKDTEFYKIAKNTFCKNSFVFVTGLSVNQIPHDTLNLVHDYILCGIDQLPNALVYLNETCPKTVALKYELKNFVHFYTLDNIHL